MLHGAHSRLTISVRWKVRQMDQHQSRPCRLKDNEAKVIFVIALACKDAESPNLELLWPEQLAKLQELPKRDPRKTRTLPGAYLEIRHLAIYIRSYLDT